MKFNYFTMRLFLFSNNFVAININLGIACIFFFNFYIFSYKIIYSIERKFKKKTRDQCLRNFCEISTSIKIKIDKYNFFLKNLL